MISRLPRLMRNLTICCFVATQHAYCQEMGDIAQAVERNINKFEKIDNLYIAFKLDYEHFRGPRIFTLKEANVHYWRKKGKSRLLIEGIQARDGEVAKAEYAWNEKECASLEGDHFSIIKNPDTRMFRYNYYINFLSFPGALSRVPLLLKGKDVPPAITSLSWLPDVITKRTSAYSIKLKKNESGDDCVVLENPKGDVFWFDTTREYAMSRRDTFDPSNGRLKVKTICRDFEFVLGVWLPKLVIRDEFSVIVDSSLAPESPTGRKTLTVKQVATSFIPDSFFRLEAPIGVTVHDPVRKKLFTRVAPGDNLVVKATEIARERRLPPRSTSWSYMLGPAFLLAIVVGCVLFLVRLWLRWR